MFWSKRTILLALSSALALFVEATNADYIFGTPTDIGPSSYTSPSISTDGLSLYVDAQRSGGYGGYDVWMYTRKAVHDDWSGPYNLGPTINTPYGEGNPEISADGLTLIFDSNRNDGHGDWDMWMVRRETIHGPWSEPVNLAINSPYLDAHSSISTDGLSLFFCSTRPGGYGDRDTWLSTRATTNDPWSEPVNLGPIVNSASFDSGADISSDGLMLFFDSRRPGGSGRRDIWVARRVTTDGPWSEPVNLGPTVNTSSNDFTACISADGSMLYFWSNGHLRQVPIDPVVDLNGDGVVNSGDMTVMVNHWGEDYPSCDIGLMPWGDGIVDVQDLIVLAEHLFENVNDPTLVAHWPLDEAEGMVVTDSVGDNDGYALGDPLWQPDGGQVNGALEFDGVDDFISAPAPLSPADGLFSVFAWIKGGAVGQAIISEPGGPDWMSLDPVTGFLMTDLTSGGRSGAPLVSQTAINDGHWHRIGLVWDGLYRTLYVDGVVAAEDPQDGLENTGNGFYIGTGKDMAPGTYFSGLIDDVRIYNRAMKL